MKVQLTKSLIRLGYVWQNRAILSARKWFSIGEGTEPFQSCVGHTKNCLTTRNKSLLHDPHYIIDSIVFHGVHIPMSDFKKIKEFKTNSELVKKQNRGISPKIVLFMMVIII